MRLIVIKGEITGSIMIGKSNKIKLSKRITGGEIVLANEADMSMYPISGDSIEVAATFDVDRCMVMDNSGHMIGFGSSLGGVDRKALLEAYYSIKRANTSVKKSIKSTPKTSLISKSKENDSMKGSEVIKDASRQNNSSNSTIKSENVINNRKGIFINADEKIDNAIDLTGEVMSEIGINVGMTAKFYNSVHNDIDALFAIYPHNVELENIVFDSIWINVESGTPAEYSVGVIRDDGVPTVIVYAVPKPKYECSSEFASGYDWLPLDKSNPKGKGYFVAYQDAVTGQMLKE